MTSATPPALSSRQRTTLILATALLALTSALAWLLFRRTLAASVLDLVTRQALPLFAATLLAFFFTLALIGVLAAVLRDRWLARSLSLAFPAAYLVLFGPSVLHALAALLLLLGLWHYDDGVAEEVRDRRAFSMHKTLRQGLNGMLTATLLAMSLTFFGTVVRGAPLLSPVETLARTAAGPVNQVLVAQLPGYNPNDTLDQFLLAQALRQLPDVPRDAGTVQDLLGNESDALAPYLERIPRSTRERLAANPAALEQYAEQQFGVSVSERLNDARTALLARFNIQARGEEPMGEVVTRYLTERLRGWFGPYEFLLPPILALTFFFSLSVFLAVYHLCIAALAGLLFWFGKNVRLVSVTSTEAPVDTPHLTDEP